MIKTLWVDTETTGLNSAKCAIIQLSCLVEIDGKVVDQFNENLAPHRMAQIDDAALKVNNKTEEDFVGYQSASEGYENFHKFLKSYVNPYNKKDKFIIAGYNVQFDIDFVSALFKRNRDEYLGSFIYRSFVDVLYLVGFLRYQGLIPADELTTNKLSDVAEYFGITDFAAHDSLEDIRVTRELSILLLEELRRI